jgi:hypothetical protein
MLGCTGSGPQTGGQTGTEGPQGTLNRGVCEPEPTEIAFDDDGLGFSASDVLEVAGGTRTAELAWEAPATRELQPGVTLSFGPEQGQTSLELSVEYQGGPTRRVHYVLPESDAEGPVIAMDAVCPEDTLEVEVVVTARTAGGALDETFTTSLVAQDPQMATLSQSLELDALAGSFEVDLSAPDDGVSRSISALLLDARLVRGGMSGTLSGGVETSGDASADGMESVSSYALVTCANWPADSVCQLGTEVPVSLDQSPQASRAVADLPEDRSVDLSWASGTDTELGVTVDPVGDSVCWGQNDAAMGEGAGAWVWMPVEISLGSSDGRVDTALPGKLEVWFDEATSAVSITGELACDSGASDTWGASCGVSGYDATGFDGLRVRATMESTDAETALGGTLAVEAATIPECMSGSVKPEDDDPDGDSPGCAGIEWTTLDTGTFTFE